MKILLVTPYFYPKIGGLEKYAYKLAKGLIAKGDEVVVVTANHITKQRIDEVIEDIKVIRLPVAFKFSNTPINFAWRKQIKQIIKLEAPDLINAHSPVPFIADVAFSARGKTPFVLTYHAGSLKKGHTLIDIVLGLYEATVLKYMFKRCVKIISVYPAFIKSMVSDHNKIVFIPPGVDTDFFNLTNRKKDSDVLFVGRIEKTASWKGLDVLIEVISKLKQTRPHITLRIVGDGDAKNDFELMVQNLNLTKNVIFNGPLNGKQLVEAYSRSKLLVLPSLTDAEAFGTVLIEAMSCGTPVIGSNIGGVSNVIQDGINGFLVQSGNTTEIVSAVNAMLDDPELVKKLSQNGRRIVLEKFSDSYLIEDTHKLFHDICRLSIVHVVSNYPPHLGGMESVVEILADMQQTAELNVQVLTSDNHYDHAYQDSVTVQRSHSVEIANTPIFPGLIPALLGIKPNTIVHVHIAQAFSPEAVWLCSRIKHYKYVAHVHLDVGPSGSAGFLLKIYKPLILKRVLKKADKIIVFTTEQKDTLAKKYGIDHAKIAVIPNGVNEFFINNTTRVLHNKPRILYVGRLSVQKNVEQLLRALNGISKKFNTSIVGDGERALFLQNLARELHISNVQFLGRLSGKNLNDQYKASDIFVLPSEREGMPLVLLEAMASGLPPIVTDVQGNKEIVRDGTNGLLVGFNDDRALQKKLLDVVADQALYSKLSKGARKTAIAYTWPNVIKQIDNLYAEVSPK